MSGSNETKPAVLEARQNTLTLKSADSELDGIEIFYEEMGSGPTIMLLHGLNDTHRSWRGVLPYLAQSHRVVVPDLPGCGLSARPDASYALGWQARVMGAFLEQLGLHNVDLVGHSYGGGVAQYMLLSHAHLIRRLALVSAGGLGREVSLELRAASLRLVEHFGQPFMSPVAVFAQRAVGGVVTADDAEWLREINSRPGTARAFARTVRDVISWRGQTKHFLDRAAEIASLPPIALFWGCKDRVIPYSHALQTIKILTGSSLTTFRDAGHFPHHEQPQAFVKALLAFLDAPRARRTKLVVPSEPTKLPAVARVGLLERLRGLLSGESGAAAGIVRA